MKIFFTALFLLVFMNLSAQSNNDTNLKLWYDKPAIAWEQALPLGNSMTGAMVFGTVNKEHYQLNDHTLWSGEPLDGNNANGPKILPLVRKQIFEGHYDSASALYKKMQGPYSARYLPLADLWLSSLDKDSSFSQYYRDLNLNNATAIVKFEKEGVHFLRESFISYPDKIMAIRITADKKGQINLRVALNSKLRYSVESQKGGYLLLKGKAPKYVASREYEKEQVVYDNRPDGEGMRFEVLVKLINDGGQLINNRGDIIVKNANSLTIYLAEATSFNGFDKSPSRDAKNPDLIVRSTMNKVLNLSYEKIYQRHVRDYRNLFARVAFKLKTDRALEKLPTDERLKQFASAPVDHGLQVLYYQYGRYLLISSSRPGSPPANLQGIWNQYVQPPWGSNYTTNINTEMNYWLAENTNLSECHQPLFDFIQELAVNGAKTAKVNYGIQQGWLAHHNSDIWAKTSPTGGYDKDPKGTPRWSAWVMAGAWLSTHLWEHYLYTGDKIFLQKEAYPAMKGAADFMLHWLIKDPQTGYLITNPSTSPENTIKINGKEYDLSMASTMDMSIIRELFTDLIRATEALGIDASYRKELVEAKAKLYPYHIGQHGQIQEWFKDWDDPNDKHRHISQLFGLYPGSQITINNTPELAAAAKESLIERGDVSTGWSMAWKTNWWARLHDGQHAYKILSAAFTYIDPQKPKAEMSGGGTYPNLFDAHPPFQIDGNFGATAGMTEMLLQSHDGELSLLPALPDQWSEGYIKGIKARGDFTIQINWKAHKLQKASIYSALGGQIRLRTLQKVRVVGAMSTAAKGILKNSLLAAYGKPPYEKNKQAKLQEINNEPGYVIDFNTQKGKTYTIVPM